MGQLWKKEGNKYVQYRGDGSKTGKTKLINKSSKDKPKYVSPRERKFGKDKKKEDLKITKKVDKYVAKRKGDIKPLDPKQFDNRRPKTVVKKTEKKENKQNNQEKVAPKQKLKIKATTTGGPVKSGVEYARSKGDDLAGYRRTKDTRITKKLKKAGFTEDRLARLRKDHADWKAKRKKKKKS